MASNGFEIGTGQNGATLPSGLPPAVAQQISLLAHDVFTTAFIDAMKATLIVPIAFLVFTALTTAPIRGMKQPPARQAAEAEREELRAAAG